MKSLFFAVLMSIPFTAFADGVEMSFAPRSPAVFRASTQTPDGKPVPGPYFALQIAFNSDREALVNALQVYVASSEGATMAYNISLDEAVHVGPGVTAHTGVLFFGALPFSHQFVYTVAVRATGNFVENAGTGQAFDVQGTFLTQ